MKSVYPAPPPPEFTCSPLAMLDWITPECVLAVPSSFPGLYLQGPDTFPPPRFLRYPLLCVRFLPARSFVRAFPPPPFSVLPSFVRTAPDSSNWAALVICVARFLVAFYDSAFIRHPPAFSYSPPLCSRRSIVTPGLPPPPYLIHSRITRIDPFPRCQPSFFFFFFLRFLDFPSRLRCCASFSFPLVAAHAPLPRCRTNRFPILGLSHGIARFFRALHGFRVSSGVPLCPLPMITACAEIDQPARNCSNARRLFRPFTLYPSRATPPPPPDRPVSKRPAVHPTDTGHPAAHGSSRSCVMSPAVPWRIFRTPQ